MLGTYCETSASPRPVSSRLRRSLPVYNTLKSRHSSNICYRVIASFVFLASTVSRLASRVSLLHSPQPGLSGLAASLLAMKSLAHGDRVTLESRRSPGERRDVPPEGADGSPVLFCTTSRTPTTSVRCGSRCDSRCWGLRGHACKVLRGCFCPCYFHLYTLSVLTISKSL